MTCQCVLDITLKDGAYDAFAKWLIAVLPDTRAYDGCVNVEVVRNQDDPTKLLFLEKWESRQHYERYLAWRVETGILEELDEFIVGELGVQYFDLAGI